MKTQELSSNESFQGLNANNENQELKSSFLQDARAIVEIGKDVPNAAGNIAKHIQYESGTHKFPIKEAVEEEAWEIYDEGDGIDNKPKRVIKVNELALRMGFKIMETLYPTDYEISESAYLSDEDLEGFGSGFTIFLNGDDGDGEGDEDAEAGSESGIVPEDEDDLTKLVSFDFKCLIDAINKKKDAIIEIIYLTSTDEPKLADKINDQAPHIARMITNIPEISDAIDSLPECTNISPGIMRATIEYMLIIYASFILKRRNSKPKDFVEYINDLFLNIKTLNRTIGKAMFGLVIAEVIKDNADDISGRSKYGPSASTISKKVETSIIRGGLMQGDKRRCFLLKALAYSVSHNIVRSMVDSKILPESISNVVSERIKAIIVDKVDDIAGYYSAVVNPESIVSKVLSNVEHITGKIDQIVYDSNKSILIELQQRPSSPTGSSTQYELKLVKNDKQDSSLPESSGSGGNISVSSVSCLPSSNYICVTHKINLHGDTKETDIGGLRLYFGGKEVETFDTTKSEKKSVFYKQGKKDVKVYFYSRTVSPPETNKRLLDKTPLLFEYNANFYRPLDRDNYFHKWVFIDCIKGSVTELTQQLTKKLDYVNKFLNLIDLDQIATMWDTSLSDDVASNNCYRKLYGIPYPGKDPPDNRVNKSYDRLYVTACVTDNYRKQTHWTINKYGIGDVYLHGHKVTEITSTEPLDNQVSVYYEHSDHHFSRPLLILLTSQAWQGGEEPSRPQTNKWYKRTDLDGRNWAIENDSSFHESGDDGQLKEKLTEIASGLYTALTIELHEKKGYEKDLSVISGRTDKSTIIVEQKCLPGIPSVQGYRCWEHNLSEYYNNINNALNSQQDGGQAHKQTSPELTFVLDVAISGIKVGLFTAQDRVAPVLAYTKADYNSKRSLVVYFCGNDGLPDDPVPLMFNYNGKFYGPLIKDKYFGHWRELNISSPVSSSSTQLKSELDRIYHMLNGIDLTQTKTYGLNCSSEHPYYYKPGGLNTKRVIVTKYSNGTHTMYVHQTVHRTSIGDITHGNSEYKFNSHSSSITTKTINEVAVIFNGSSSTDIPLLVLLNQAGPGLGDGGDASSDAIKQSTTHGYYHKKIERGDQPTVYTYHNIERGCILMSKLVEQGSDGDDCVAEHTQPINDTLSQITGSTMTKDDTSGESEQESVDCKGPFGSEFKEPKCDGAHQQEIPDNADLLEVQEEDSESILPCSASSDCETGSEELEGSDSIASNASTGVQRSKRSKRSHRESTGVEVPNGELGASGGHWSSSNGKPILSRLVGRDESEIRHKQLDLYCKFIVAFVATASYLIFHMLDITSRHFAVSFDIPEHNISIYFDKLYSLRCLCMVIGYFIGYSLYQIGGGDRNGKNEGLMVMKYVGIISFSLLLIVRTAFLAILYISTQLSYHVYMVIFLEGLIYSVHEQALLGLAPNYMSVINFMFHGDRLIILCIQFFLDLWFFKRPLIMIKIQIWICVLLTAPGVGFWWYYNFRLKTELDELKSSSSKSEIKGSEVNGTENNVALNDVSQNLSIPTIDQDKDGIDAVVVPFMMFLGASMFKDFLYPGTIPYALLHRDKCHTINMCIPIVGNIGSVMNLIIDIYGLFVRWEWYYNLFLFLVIPMVIIFVYSILAIHTRIPSALRIRNSLHRVMAIALTMIFCHGNLEPLSYLAICKYAARGNAYGFTILAGFQTTCLLSRSIFARLSAGYTVIRVSLGYHLPKFRPNHRMSKYNTFFYIVRQTGRRSWVDLKTDFKFDIKNYL